MSNGVEMTNTNTLPSWDEIFTNLAVEVESYATTPYAINQ